MKFRYIRKFVVDSSFFPEKTPVTIKEIMKNEVHLMYRIFLKGKEFLSKNVLNKFSILLNCLQKKTRMTTAIKAKLSNGKTNEH